MAKIKFIGIIVFGIIHLAISLVTLGVILFSLWATIVLNINLFEDLGIFMSFSLLWALLFSIIGIFIAIGILRRRELARRLVIILSYLNFIWAPLIMIWYLLQENMPLQTLISSLFSLVYSIIIIRYFSKREIKSDFLGQTPRSHQEQ